MPSLPRVHVGVPVWHGEQFVGETMQSILSQSGVDITVFISIDGNDKQSAAACSQFLDDPRVSLSVQTDRLGWVGNCNAVIEAGWHSGSEFFCIHPHDDLMEPGYLAELVLTAENSPQASTVFSDIAAFGAMNIDIHQPSVVGTPLERQLSLLRDHFAAVAFRGLIRRSKFKQAPLLSANEYENFAADTVFMARLAHGGDLLRVPKKLYRKRYHENNTHTAWNKWDRERQVAAWTRHCIDLCTEAMSVTDNSAELSLIAETARARLLQSDEKALMYGGLVNSLESEKRAALSAAFDAGIGTRHPPNLKDYVSLRLHL